VQQLRSANVQSQSALQDVAKLQAQLDYVEGPTFPKDYRAVNTTVISFPGTTSQQVTIAAGANRGIRLNTPVVTADGLIGHVTVVGRDTAQVTLLTDSLSSVPAVDVTQGVSGIIRHGPRGTFTLDRVSKEATVKKDDIIVTRGTVDRRYPDYYPYGIQIGTVLSASANDIATFLTVQVKPFASFGSLDAVAALVPTKRK
jgi:rod shape-determining protein MreC